MTCCRLPGRRRYYLAVGLNFLVLIGSLCLLTPRQRAAADETPPLRFCADPDNLPFSSANAATPGFYVELGGEIAKQLGRAFEPVWVPTFYAKRQVRQKLLSGQCDGFLGLPAEGAFMGPRLIFSQPVAALGYALVAPAAPAVNSPDDLHGRRVAVQFATPPQDLLAARNDVTMVTVNSPEEAMQDLAKGEADAAFIWGPSAGWLNATVMHGTYRVVPFNGENMQWNAVIGFPRDSAPLRDAVDRALAGLHGRIEQLAAKYDFPEATDQGLVAAGRELFNQNCSHCHGPDAVQGEQRRNLRLLERRYGDNMQQMFMITVTHGRVTRGMPNWSGILSSEELGKIYAFLASVQDHGS